MLNILVVIAVVLALAIAAVLAMAIAKPDTFKVQRAISIAASPERIFALIEDFHRWGLWSPYEHRDPAMQRHYSGPNSGKGAVYEWSGNKKVGSGRMEVLDTSAPAKIVIKLDFFTPFEGHNTAEFTMSPQGDTTAGTTNVIWAMYGPAPLMSKVMQVFMNMDTMIGRDFEVGLTNLKTVAET